MAANRAQSPRRVQQRAAPGRGWAPSAVRASLYGSQNIEREFSAQQSEKRPPIGAVGRCPAALRALFRANRVLAQSLPSLPARRRTARTSVERQL